MDALTHTINIGPGQRAMRYRSTVVLLIGTLGLRQFLVASRAPRRWQMVLYIPLAITALAFFEAQEQTCAVLAARGECSLDQHFSLAQMVRGEPVADQARAARLRRQAWGVIAKSQGIAIGLTLLLILLPRRAHPDDTRGL